MSMGLVILILFVGWALLFLEIFIIPGSFVFAVIGTMTMFAGVVISYSVFGAVEGTITLLITALFSFLSIVFGFRSGIMNGLMLHNQSKGKMNEIDEKKIKPGDEGIALSKIAPIGKGLFNDVTYEVQSLGEWIIEGTAIEVLKISLNKVIVKAKTPQHG
ncbi:MAG: hypothetical protein ABIQ74_14450 [Chitinophagales bacterium]